MRIKQITVYEFEELSPKAKRKVIDHFQNINVNHEWHEPEIDYWQEKLKEYGFNNPKIYFSGFYSQGDGACFDFNGLDIEKIWTFYMAHNVVKHSAWLKSYLCECAFKTHTSCSRYCYAGTRMIVCDYYSNKVYPHLNKAIREFEIWLDVFRIDLCQEIYSSLQKEYESLTTEEAIIDTIKCNDYEFTAEGKVA